jgi:hypothetical protein
MDDVRRPGRGRFSSVGPADHGAGPSGDRLARDDSGAVGPDSGPADRRLDLLGAVGAAARRDRRTGHWLLATGAAVDTSELLHAVARRLLPHPCHADDHQTQSILADVRCLLGLAWYSLLDPDGARAGQHRWEQHLDWVPQLRVLETDTAVDLALADSRRERGE